MVFHWILSNNFRTLRCILAYFNSPPGISIFVRWNFSFLQFSLDPFSYLVNPFVLFLPCVPFVLICCIYLCDQLFHHSHKKEFSCRFSAHCQCLSLIWLTLMTVFCADIIRDSISLYKFPLRNRVKINSWPVFLVCHLKYPYLIIIIWLASFSHQR